MSKLGLKNLIQASQWGRLIRTEHMRRDEPLFYSDIGEAPIEKDRAYQMGVQGLHRVWTGSWRRGRWVDTMPAMPVDCLRPFDAGLVQCEADRAAYDDEYDPCYQDFLEKQAELEDELMWLRGGEPLVDPWDAFDVAEREAQQRKERELQMLADGVPSDDDIPVFMTRARNLGMEGSW